jgi:hypothetical protein
MELQFANRQNKAGKVIGRVANLSSQIVVKAYEESKAFPLIMPVCTAVYLTCGGKQEETETLTNEAAEKWFGQTFGLTKRQVYSFQLGFDMSVSEDQEEKDFQIEEMDYPTDMKLFIFGYRCGRKLS